MTISALIDETPARGTEHPARVETRPPLAAFRQLRENLIEVRVSTRTIGYIETAGSVYVSLAGPRYDTAEEIAQSLSVHRAAVALLRQVR